MKRVVQLMQHVVHDVFPQAINKMMRKQDVKEVSGGDCDYNDRALHKPKRHHWVVELIARRIHFHSCLMVTRVGLRKLLIFRFRF